MTKLNYDTSHPLSHDCSSCGAKAGQPCMVEYSPAISTSVAEHCHVSRQQAAAKFGAETQEPGK